MAVEATLPQIGTVVFTALIDSINPCAIGVLILLVTVMLSHSKTRSKMMLYGFAYVTAVMITYLLAGLGLLYFLHTIPLVVTAGLSILVAGVLIAASLIEIKDFFWYGQGISLAIPPERAKQIHNYVKHISLPGVIALGVFVAGVELPCTGAPYLAIIAVLSQNFNFSAFLLLVLYNIVFVLPLVAILAAVYLGVKITSIKRWKHANRGYMRLAMGLLLIFLAWLLIMISGWVFAFD